MVVLGGGGGGSYDRGTPVHLGIRPQTLNPAPGGASNDVGAESPGGGRKEAECHMKTLMSYNLGSMKFSSRDGLY